MRFLFLVLFILSSSTSFAQRDQQSRQTNPVPPKTKKADPLDRMNMATQIPSNPEQYKFVATTKNSGVDIGSTEVQVWGFGPQGSRYNIGTVTPGTEISIDYFHHRGTSLYFAIPYENIQPKLEKKGQEPKWAWISGRNIEVMAK